MDSRGDPAFLDVERRARQVGDPINSLMEKIDEAADVLDGFRREGLDVSDARAKKQYATIQLYCQTTASPKKEQVNCPHQPQESSTTNPEPMRPSTLLRQLLGSLSCFAKTNTNSMAGPAAWQTYDQLVDICIARAETLQLEINDAQDRVQERDDCDTTGEHHEDILQKWTKSQTSQGLATQSERLCGRERTERVSIRTRSPYDTELASQS